MARNIHETPCLILIKYKDDLNNLSVNELIGLFSCFTNIKVKKINKKTCINENESSFVKELIEKIVQELIYYENIEKEKNIQSNINYNNVVIYDIFDEIQIWSKAKSDIEYKRMLQIIHLKGISIGDFSKAILKISAITNEFISLYNKKDESNYISLSLYNKLCKIDSLLLKSIFTKQSLYI